MQGYVGDASHLPEAQKPNVENLLRHYNAYGLDNRTNTYRGVVQPYKSYKALSKDALVEVARAYLSEDAYAFLIESIGYGSFKDAARADHAAMREGG